MSATFAHTVERSMTGDSVLFRPEAMLTLEFFDPAYDHPYVETTRIQGQVALSSILPSGAQIVRSFRKPSGIVVLARSEQASFLISVEADRTDVMVGATTPELTSTLMTAVTSNAAPVDESRARVSIWRKVSMSQTFTRKLIECPEWPAIERNYASPVRRRIAELVGLVDPPDANGRLILWHGEPGTGKTTALRTLIRAWEPWCSTHYISDPERFFDDPNYMFAVVSDTDDFDQAPDLVNAAKRAKRPRLVIAEDCDDAIRARPRRDNGAAFGRLLNLTDGILGQGLRTLVLLTTNEPVGRLHPALIRPGRCLDITEFTPLEPAEATAWLGEPVTSSCTVADLYARRRSSRIIPPSQGALTTGQYL